ncbi:Os10g0568200 [Oryza sativa Japonica Group]|uniref:Os10g0568200 protein n=2 Tax=Oryza sativa subsp. japonica TaxID=39947 RepID=B9G737_ORYSJ|nr:hypothetical protein OsJ_32519 [Oryza sativa Japonica Group]KAB8113764.1 hypothetical protein EE612_052882 [Oryza sativa]BAT12137.1 Os10g0568200 [Oryza sativa Japonica Group]
MQALLPQPQSHRAALREDGHRPQPQPSSVLVLIIIMELLVLLLIPLLTSALSFSTAAPLRPGKSIQEAQHHSITVAVRVSSSAGERLSRPAFTAEVTRDLSAPADSANSAQTVATSAAAEASTVLSFLSAPAPPELLLSSQADTTPAIAAASWATETAAWACAVCSRSSSRLFLRLPAMGMLSIKYPLRIALMCPMFSCSFSVETKSFRQFTSLCQIRQSMMALS